jgi:hypothetical protein
MSRQHAVPLPVMSEENIEIPKKKELRIYYIDY